MVSAWHIDGGFDSVAEALPCGERMLFDLFGTVKKAQGEISTPFDFYTHLVGFRSSLKVTRCQLMRFRFGMPEEGKASSATSLIHFQAGGLTSSHWFSSVRVPPVSYYPRNTLIEHNAS